VLKISEISTTWIARCTHWSSLKSFFGLAKHRVAALHKLTFSMKNVQNGGASLDSSF